MSFNSWEMKSLALKGITKSCSPISGKFASPKMQPKHDPEGSVLLGPCNSKFKTEFC